MAAIGSGVRQFARVMAIYLAAMGLGVLAAGFGLVGPSTSLPGVLLIGIALAAPGLALAAIAATIMLRNGFGARPVSIVSGRTATVAGAFVIVPYGLGRSQPDPDMFFDPTGILLVGALAAQAAIASVAGALVARTSWAR